MSVAEMFMNVGVFGKLVFIAALVLIPISAWWLHPPRTQRRLSLFLVLCFLPMGFGIGAAIEAYRNIGALFGLDVIALEIAKEEALVPLVISLTITLYFLIIGLIAETFSRIALTQRLPKGLFVGSVAISLVISDIALVFVYFPPGSRLLGSLCSVLVVVAGLVGGLVTFLFVYRMWQAVDPRFARMSPARSVGFLFIPLFNLYWVFQVFSGFARDFNRMNDENGERATPLSPKTFGGLTALMVFASPWPVIGLIGTVAMLVLIARTCNAVNEYYASPLPAIDSEREGSAVPHTPDSATAGIAIGLPIKALSAVVIAAVLFIGGKALVFSVAPSAPLAAEREDGEELLPDGDALDADFVAPPPDAESGWIAELIELPDVSSGDELPDPDPDFGVFEEISSTPGEPLRVGGDVKRPVAIHTPQPEYPEVARKARVAGIVIVEATIDKSGNVTNVKMLKSLPLGLGEAALEAVRQWKFEPATLHGEPVDVYFNVTVKFSIQ